MPPCKILLVDDYEPFRHFVRLALEARTDLQIIGEASDGLEALQKAQEVHPDLILLDIGLPRLNGIEVAKRIGHLSPSSKIIFLSQENSPEVVHAALSTGSRAYVNKARVRSDLLAAIELVLAGRLFVSSGLKGWGPSEKLNAEAPHRHEILFCSDDEVLLGGLTGFIGAALKVDDSAIVLATEPHREILLERLRKEVDVDAAIRQGTYVSLDAAENPDPVRFSEIINCSLEAARKVAKAEHPRVALCGERAGRLWADGKLDDAIRLEQFCDELAGIYDLDILCAYPISLHDQVDEHALQRICERHSTVYSY